MTPFSEGNITSFFELVALVPSHIDLVDTVIDPERVRWKPRVILTHPTVPAVKERGRDASKNTSPNVRPLVDLAAGGPAGRNHAGANFPVKNKSRIQSVYITESRSGPKRIAAVDRQVVQPKRIALRPIE
jgi:hypothetical protein